MNNLLICLVYIRISFVKFICGHKWSDLWCDIWCKIHDVQWLFVDDIEQAWGKSAYKLLKACMRLDLFYQDRKATKYNSIVCILHKLHVRAVGSSCTHLYMIYQLLTGLKQLLIGLRLLTRPSLLPGTWDSIHFL